MGRPRKRWCTISIVHQPHDTCDGTPAPQVVDTSYHGGHFGARRDPTLAKALENREMHQGLEWYALNWSVTHGPHPAGSSLCPPYHVEVAPRDARSGNIRASSHYYGGVKGWM